MPDTSALGEHAEPFFYDDGGTRSLHFSLGELQSRMRLESPDSLEVEYTRAMMGFLLFNARPSSIVMIGLGGGSMPKFCYRHLPDAHILAVEINPRVIALRDRFQVPRDDARFRVVEGDGAQFVRDTNARVDVLLVDGYDQQGLSTSLTTQAFYDDCHQTLSGEGMLVVNLHAAHPEFDLLLTRIDRSFEANVLRVNVKREGNVVVFAFKGGLDPKRRRGALSQPESLDKSAWSELRPTFKQVLACLHERG